MLSQTRRSGEMVYTLDSGSSGRKAVEVQVLSPAPTRKMRLRRITGLARGCEHLASNFTRHQIKTTK